jgi:predicted ester cyclase
MIRTLRLAATLALAGAAALTQAQAITSEQARAIVAPFYDGLNAAPGKDPLPLLLQATHTDWVSCGGNDSCSPRDKVVNNIAGFHKAIPDLKWEIKDILVAGNRIVVRGEASGTPAGPLFGVPHSGKSFKVMSIDIHEVRDGKLLRAYHIEDWMGASRQLAGR